MAETTKKDEPKMVTIKLPRIKDKPTEFVSINMKTYMIQRGVEVDVPDFVAEAFINQEKMLAEADAFDQAAQHK